MNTTHLRGVDLNLLVVLDELLRHRSVTDAAAVLDVTPSAVSHALRRLRSMFDDELLLRDGRRMRLTVRAEGLAESLPRVLEQVARTIEPPEPFRPATSTRTFRLAAPDFLAPLVPRLLHDVRAAAPTVQVELTAYAEAVGRHLAEGRVDALVAPDFVGDDDLRGTPLGSWPWVVFGRRGHPAFDDWSPRAWADHPHLRVRASSTGGGGPVDDGAAALGLRREVGATVPYFSMAAPVLARTDLLLTVPSVAADASPAAADLDHRPLPFDVPPLALSLLRNAASGDEPGVRWFLARVEAVFDGADHGVNAIHDG